jgi:hypothetical protein
VSHSMGRLANSAAVASELDIDVVTDIGNRDTVDEVFDLANAVDQPASGRGGYSSRHSGRPESW